MVVLGKMRRRARRLQPTGLLWASLFHFGKAGDSGVGQNAPLDAAHAPRPAALLQPTCLLWASMFHFGGLGSVVLGKMRRFQTNIPLHPYPLMGLVM